MIAVTEIAIVDFVNEEMTAMWQSSLGEGINRTGRKDRNISMTDSMKSGNTPFILSSKTTVLLRSSSVIVAPS